MCVASPFGARGAAFVYAAAAESVVGIGTLPVEALPLRQRPRCGSWWRDAKLFEIRSGAVTSPVSMTVQVVIALGIAVSIVPQGLAHAVLVEANPAAHVTVVGPEVS